MACYSKNFIEAKTALRAFIKIDNKTQWFIVQDINAEEGFVYLGINKTRVKISDVEEWEYLYN